MLFGGSFASESETWLAKTVTWHSSPLTRSVFGLRVTVFTPVVPPTKAKPMDEPAAGHLMSKLLAVTSTFSLKLMVMLVVLLMSIAPLVGVVVVTDGAASVV